MKKKNALKHICSVVALAFMLILAVGSSDSSSSSSSGSSSSGEVVENSAWDGSVRQVKSWLKNNLKDPGSTEYIEWSPLQKTGDGGFMVRVKYRSKNSFGGYVVANQLFTLDSSGNVTGYVDY